MTFHPDNRFFITGCQRSGTTLLRLMLDAHPNIRCFDEAVSYDLLRVGTEKQFPDIDENLVGFKIPRWGDILDSGFIPDMLDCPGSKQFYKREPVLFLLRDPRDVVASMLSLQFINGSWLEVVGLRDLMQRLQSSASARDEYKKELDFIFKNESLAGGGALLWRMKTEAFLRYLDLGFPVLGVQYETLVSDSESILRKILNYLSCRWDPAVLEHHKKSHHEVNKDGLTVGHTAPNRPVDRSSVGRWQAILSDKDQEAVNLITADLARKISTRL